MNRLSKWQFSLSNPASGQVRALAFVLCQRFARYSVLAENWVCFCTRMIFCRNTKTSRISVFLFPFGSFCFEKNMKKFLFFYEFRKFGKFLDAGYLLMQVSRLVASKLKSIEWWNQDQFFFLLEVFLSEWIKSLHSFQSGGKNAGIRGNRKSTERK